MTKKDGDLYISSEATIGPTVDEVLATGHFRWPRDARVRGVDEVLDPAGRRCLHRAHRVI